MDELLMNGWALYWSAWNAGRYMFGITSYEWALGLLSHLSRSN